ncbi:hypothetical protein EN871_21755 [bacterium M00.F.Ca.ET.228.01.1.1]|nr:hypothetical protein EN871_21755 [bacterium M00.F.Ca.ET.228.01.1.1]TGR98411.1 hypothetical protein EN834_21370 [bacterium M00.F.Ca.ET.191.01.1.1]TGU02745.1 hypothetical protein EN798_22190 [bacterium M00.F.Ca.ET.155.01.1.1]
MAFQSNPQCELLCYLVVAQLIARARTGEWLRTDHFVESLNIWLNANGAHADWIERMQLKMQSEMVAMDFGALPHMADEAKLAELFSDGWRLDYRSPVVQSIYAACERELAAR